jgi:hypothetical protein
MEQLQRKTEMENLEWLSNMINNVTQQQQKATTRVTIDALEPTPRMNTVPKTVPTPRVDTEIVKNMLSEITALPRVNKSPPKVATQVEQGPGSGVTACMKYERALKNLTI